MSDDVMDGLQREANWQRERADKAEAALARELAAREAAEVSLAACEKANDEGRALLAAERNAKEAAEKERDEALAVMRSRTDAALLRGRAAHAAHAALAAERVANAGLRTWADGASRFAEKVEHYLDEAADVLVATGIRAANERHKRLGDEGRAICAEARSWVCPPPSAAPPLREGWVKRAVAAYTPAPASVPPAAAPQCGVCKRDGEDVPDGIRNEARLVGHRWWCPACGHAICAYATQMEAPFPRRSAAAAAPQEQQGAEPEGVGLDADRTTRPSNGTECPVCHDVVTEANVRLHALIKNVAEVGWLWLCAAQTHRAPASAASEPKAPPSSPSIKQEK